jgi:hypothetical protein
VTEHRLFEGHIRQVDAHSLVRHTVLRFRFTITAPTESLKETRVRHLYRRDHLDTPKRTAHIHGGLHQALSDDEAAEGPSDRETISPPQATIIEPVDPDGAAGNTSNVGYQMKGVHVVVSGISIGVAEDRLLNHEHFVPELCAQPAVAFGSCRPTNHLGAARHYPRQVSR